MNNALSLETSLAHRILALISEDGSWPGNPVHLARIEAFVARGLPVRLVLPGFPAKSSNRRKTLGELPDYGEVLGLMRLNSLCSRIARIHAPGARVVICSDGRVFNDLVFVPDAAVDAYGRAIRDIIAAYGLTNLSTYDLDDVSLGQTCRAEMRRQLVADHGVSLTEVRRRIEADQDQRQLFNGIHRFLFEDKVVLDPALSRSRAREVTKELAYSVIQRSNAWSALVEAHFPDAVRLSIHPQPEGSLKIGYRLVASNDCWRTPWHSAVLFDGTAHQLVRREEAEALQAELVLADGKYPYFVSNHATH